jgi:hypothetical protein
MPATRIRLLRPYCSNVNREIEQSSVIPHLSLSEEDIDKIATAVKQKITVDIESIIAAKTNITEFKVHFSMNLALYHHC